MSEFHDAGGRHLGLVILRVASLPRALDFYEGLLGLAQTRVRGSSPLLDLDDAVYLGTSTEAQPLIGLVEDAEIASPILGVPGLYHLAFLLPERVDLARAVARLLRANWPLEGASDHVVSEAVYLSDPDGNGIELYVDRPADLWRWLPTGIDMRTLPLDLRGLLFDFRAEIDEEHTIAPDTVIGHIHLRVSDLAAAEAFYEGVLDFDVTTRAYPGALFLSSRGYHHHLGLNTWGRTIEPTPEATKSGLLAFEIVEPDPELWNQIRVRAAEEGVEIDDGVDSFRLRDQDDNLVIIRS